MKERLQKHLARAGLGSRRYCETLIEQGRVAVNGVLVDRVGFSVDPERDEIAVDGETIDREALVYYLLHKPKGFVCSSRPQGVSRSALELVKSKRGERLFSVGRLDEQSQGALILTNDGEFSNRIIHPRYGVEKTYLVVVKGKPELAMLDKIRHGIHLAEGKTAPAKVHVVKKSRTHSLVKVTLHEGKNRHLRRIFARIGLPVSEIIRLQIGSISLGSLKPGHYRELKPGEIEALLDESRVGGSPREGDEGASDGLAADDGFTPVERVAPATTLPAFVKRRDGHRVDDRGPEGRRFENKRFAGKRPDGKRPDFKRPDGKRPDGQRFSGKRPDGKRPEGKRPEGKRPDGKRLDPRKAEGARPAAKRPFSPHGDRKPSTDRRSSTDRTTPTRPRGRFDDAKKPLRDRFPAGKPQRSARPGGPLANPPQNRAKRRPSDAERTNFPADDGSPFDAFDREPEE